MTALPLPALDGQSPLGFLAALGVLRLLTDHTEHSPRLAWSTDTGAAVLHHAHPDIDDLVADLTRIVETIPPGGVLPGCSPDFPPPGEAPDKLRLRRPDLAAYAAQISRADSAAERWLNSLVTDLSLDDQQRAHISLFAAPSGKQSMRTMLEKPLNLVRENPHLLREALVAWRRYPGVSGEYLDHRVLFDATDSPNGKPAERGVPGATWLALMAYPLMRTTAITGEPRTTCWQDLGHRAGKRMIYPLWSTPLDTDTVGLLLSHPILEQAQPGKPPGPAKLLSIFRVVHATRRRLPGRTFAGVLVPTHQPLPQPANARVR